ESNSEIFFAKAGRVHPRVVEIVLQHPSQWTELIVAGKDLDCNHIESLGILIGSRRPGVGKSMALLHIMRALHHGKAKAHKSSSGYSRQSGEGRHSPDPRRQKRACTPPPVQPTGVEAQAGD